MLYLHVRQVVTFQIQGNLVQLSEVLDHILITGADVVDKGVRSISISAPQRVIAGTTFQTIIACTATQRVIACTAQQRVMASIAIQLVIAGTTFDRIGASPAMHHISFVGALQCLRLVGTHVRFVLERIAYLGFQRLIGLGINKPVRQVPQLLRGLPLDRQRIAIAEVQFRGCFPAALYLLYLHVR